MKTVAYDIMEETEESYWWYRARRDIIFATIRRIAPRGCEIVDFGCGTGGTSAALQSLGYDVVGADVSEQALEACRAKGVPAINLATEHLREGGADCILAGDVLEHLQDDVAVLTDLRRALRRDGFLVAAVPAYEFLWSGEDYVSDHVRRYTRASLVRCVHEAGYEVCWCSYFNFFLLPVIAAVTLVKRVFFPRDMYRSDVAPLPAWQNEALYKTFAFEAKLLRWLRFPLGASLLIVARPRNLEETL
jgi:SAM-dependent methyltransferase